MNGKQIRLKWIYLRHSMEIARQEAYRLAQELQKVKEAAK